MWFTQCRSDRNLSHRQKNYTITSKICLYVYTCIEPNELKHWRTHGKEREKWEKPEGKGNRNGIAIERESGEHENKRKNRIKMKPRLASWLNEWSQQAFEQRIAYCVCVYEKWICVWMTWNSLYICSISLLPVHVTVSTTFFFFRFGSNLQIFRILIISTTEILLYIYAYIRQTRQTSIWLSALTMYFTNEMCSKFGQSAHMTLNI